MKSSAVIEKIDFLKDAVYEFAVTVGARLTRTQLCIALGIHRNTIIKQLADPQFPKPLPDGKWMLSDVFLWQYKNINSESGCHKEETYPETVLPCNQSTHHLYRHYDRNGNLLYIGQSINAIRRLVEHKVNARWFFEIARVEIQNFKSKSDALLAERLSIKIEKPIHNILLVPAKNKFE